MRRDLNFLRASVNYLSVTGRISTLLLSLLLSCQAFGALIESSQQHSGSTIATSVPSPRQEQLQADRPPEAVKKTKKTGSLLFFHSQLGNAFLHSPPSRRSPN